MAVWVVESITDFVSHYLWRNLAQTIEHEARMDAYRHVQRLELAWFEDQSTGGLLAILNDDVNQLERFLDIGADEIIRTAVNIVFVGAVFFIAEPILGVVATVASLRAALLMAALAFTPGMLLLAGAARPSAARTSIAGDRPLAQGDEAVEAAASED